MKERSADLLAAITTAMVDAKPQFAKHVRRVAGFGRKKQFRHSATIASLAGAYARMYEDCARKMREIEKLALAEIENDK
jgi:hypothetical protein